MNINKLKKDFLWYSIGAAIPMILGFIKTPIFTRFYNPTDYGYFTIINTTFSYINLFAFSWILSCVWRFYIHEKDSKELNKFYTNIIALFLIGLIVTTVVSLAWVVFTNNILVRKLIIANYINLITTALLTMYLTVIRLDGKSLIYNLYTIINSVISFAILFVLTFLLRNSIDAMLNCSNIVNGLFMAYIIYKFNKRYILNMKDISRNLIKEFIRYGFAAVFFSISLLLLTSGDRYVIKIFFSIDKVGIYNQIYNLSQISIVAFINIFFNIINPYIFRVYEEDICNENEFYKYIILYIICILPFTVYFSLYSKEIANLLLGKRFRIGYKMMPYVMITSFIYGLSSMHETRLKFKNRLKAISVNLISASILNIILNFILIPSKGYELAAVTTLISYVFLYVMDIKADLSDINKILLLLKNRAKLLNRIFSILLLQIIIHYAIRQVINASIILAIIEGSVFSFSFYMYIYRNYRFLFNRKISNA